MKRPVSLLALAGLVLRVSLPSAFAATAEVNVQTNAESANDQVVDLEQILPGIWNADNCDICKLNIINLGGFLYADMADWGAYGHSYSGGYQPIDIVAPETFLYRGDYFQFYVLGANDFRVENISNDGYLNVAGANRLTYYPAPIPPRPLPPPVPRPRPPRPDPRPYPGPYPGPHPGPGPGPHPGPNPNPPHPNPPAPPRPNPPHPNPPAPPHPTPGPGPGPHPGPNPPAPRPNPPAPRPNPPAPRPNPGPGPGPGPHPGPGAPGGGGSGGHPGGGHHLTDDATSISDT